MAKKNLLSRIAMYPGADEIGCTLLARAINGQSGLTPAVYVDYLLCGKDTDSFL